MSIHVLDGVQGLGKHVFNAQNNTKYNDPHIKQVKKALTGGESPKKKANFVNGWAKSYI
jgi:hypothetical protein